jgi:hypothetical protein
VTRHACPRCGLESRCSRGGWVDRHPAAAVTAGLFALVWMSMMLSIHPVACVTLIVTGAVGGAVYFAVRERRRREALATRADYEHAQLAASLSHIDAADNSPIRRSDTKYSTRGMRESFAVPRFLAVQVKSPRRRRPGADHWSTTEPIQIGRN